MDEWMAQKGGGNDTDMKNPLFDLVYIVMDTLGIFVFAGLFILVRPRPWQSWNRLEVAFAVMKLSLVFFFLWLFTMDIAAHLNIETWSWLSQHPGRGLGLRAILLVPGVFLLFRLTR